MIYYLYVKTHNKTGLKYLGITEWNPHVYRGSGVYWERHIRKYGYDVTTEILGEYTDEQELEFAGRYYSNLWNIVESTEWANLVVESGKAGRFKTPPSNEVRLQYKAGGKKGGDIAYKNKLGLFAQTIEERQKNSQKGGKTRRNAKCFTNGEIEIRIKSNVIPEGFTKGRLKQKCSNCGQLFGSPGLYSHAKSCKDLRNADR